MWQRLTKMSRQAVFFAQQEAGSQGQNVVTAYHLLAGILHDPECIGSQILVTCGCDIQRLRAVLSERAVRGDQDSFTDMFLSEDAKRVIDLAFEHAHLLDSSYIGTEHLVLGIAAAGVVQLPSWDVSVDALRNAIVTFDPQ